MDSRIALADDRTHAIAEAAEEPPCRLSELDFTDLYVSTSGEAFMRGLIDVKDPLYPIPRGAVADLDVIHQRVCEMGQHEDEFTIDHDGVRYRVSKIDDETNPTYVLRRALDPIPRIGSFRLQNLVLRELALAGKKGSRGLILFSGPTGHGKTTTACSLLQEYLIAYGGVAIAIEDPPELKLSGAHGSFGYCYQVPVRNGDFSSPLRRAMRQAPRYIFLGEIRDPESATEALQACNSGHVVVATTHAGSIEEAVNRLLKLVSARLDVGLARDLLCEGLSVVACQEMDRIATRDGRVERRINLQTLFFANDKGLRSMIREGNTKHLASVIEQQALRVAKGQPPVDPGKGKGSGG